MRTPQLEHEDGGDEGKLYWHYRIYEVIAIKPARNDPALVAAICGSRESIGIQTLIL